MGIRRTQSRLKPPPGSSRGDTLVKKMAVDKVTIQLHNMKFLTDVIKGNIEAEYNHIAKARKLLDIIVGRGPRAFTALRMT